MAASLCVIVGDPDSTRDSWKIFLLFGGVDKWSKKESYEITGGRMEEGETSWECAVREYWEESDDKLLGHDMLGMHDFSRVDKFERLTKKGKVVTTYFAWTDEEPIERKLQNGEAAFSILMDWNEFLDKSKIEKKSFSPIKMFDKVYMPRIPCLLSIKRKFNLYDYGGDLEDLLKTDQELLSP